MDRLRYDVLDFTADRFFEAIKTNEYPLSLVKTDPHAKYLFDYLNHPDLGAQTIVVEREYVDREFLEDFAAYYVSCFYPYGRFCKRLHFFKQKISPAQFLRSIRNASKRGVQRLQNAYLGFIVIRPLPDAIIGRTQIKTYGDDKGRRHYTAIKTYEVNLSGIRLTIESMAFQEQDRAVAACATVALWSCFQKTAELFGSRSPRPPAITASATSGMIYRRALPSMGLNAEQIYTAIRAADLDPEPFKEASLTPSLLYAYLRFGVPLVLVVHVEGYTDLHAITLNGYSLVGAPIGEEMVFAKPRGAPRPMPTAMIGRRINELYGHDDQLGPFAHFYVTMPTRPNRPFTIRGGWKALGTNRVATITPVQVIAPLYRKIRLSYADARAAIQIVIILAEFVLTKMGFSRDEWEWEIYLITTSEYKKDIRANQKLSQGRIDYLLFKSQPKFFWRCTLSVLGFPLMEVGVDATEFTKSNPVFLVNHFYEWFAHRFTGLVRSIPAQRDFHPLFREILLGEYQRVDG